MSEPAAGQPEYAPLWDIPDAWAKARCPVCGEAVLSIAHLPDFPDYFKCANCEVAFDVERGGKLIRLRYIPEELKALDPSLRFTWVRAASVRREVKRRVGIGERPKPANLPPPPQALTDEDVLRRARGMYRVGNTPGAIETSLKLAGASAKQIQAISVRIKRQAEIDARRQARKVWITAGVAGTLLLLMGIWLTASGYFSAAQAVPTPSNFVEQLPVPVQQLLPTTTVQRGGSQARSTCPATSEEAAALFGGKADYWQPAQYDSWQMLNTDASITVFVPAGMRAGYIRNQSLELSTVNGPATIYGVNFITIMCE